MMHAEGAFLRLQELIQTRKDDDLGLHRMLIELFYEMSRLQRIQHDDLRDLSLLFGALDRLS